VSQNVWPKRLMITGAIVLAISIATLASVWPSWMATLDPDQNHLLKLDGGESEPINLSKESSYLLFRLDNSPHNCTIIEDATETEVTIGSPNWIQSDREGIDGEWYFAVGTFIPDENGPHVIHNDAGEGEILWVIDEMELASNSDSSYITGGCLGIIFGGCLLPIAFALWMNGRKKSANAGLVMQTADGTTIPIAPTDGTIQQRVPTTDEVWRSVRGGEILDLTVHQPLTKEEIPAPFADRPDRVGEFARVLDEIEYGDDSTPQSIEDGGEPVERSWKTWDEG
jgi:hypothetical protein